MQLYSTGRRNTGLAQTQRSHRHIARRSYARPGKCIGASDGFVLRGQKKEQLPKGDYSTGTERAPFSNRVGVNGILPQIFRCADPKGDRHHCAYRRANSPSRIHLFITPNRFVRVPGIRCDGGEKLPFRQLNLSLRF
jgi:hypothetical protein